MLPFVLRAAFVFPDRAISRFSIVLSAVLLLFTTACSSTIDRASQSSQAQRAKDSASVSTLRLGYINSGSKAQVPIGSTGWALHKGTLAPALEQSGISEVETVGFPNGPDLNEALVAGQLDLGIYGDTPALVARAKGTPTRLIAQEQVGQNVWLVAKKNGAHSLADLKGETIATSKGSYMHRYLMGALQEAGLDQQVKVVHLLPREALPALEQGSIAAYAAPIGTGPLLAAKGYPVIDDANRHPNLSGTSAVVVTEAFLAKHPDFPRVWNQMRAAAVKEIKANPEAYYQFSAEVTGFPIDVIRVSYPVEQLPDQPFPARGLALLEGTKNFLASAGLAQSDFQLSDWLVR